MKVEENHAPTGANCRADEAQTDANSAAVSQGAPPDLIRGAVYRDTRVIEIERVQENVMKERKRTKVRSQKPPSTVHVRILRADPDNCDCISIENPYASPYRLPTSFVQDLVQRGDWLPVTREPLQALRLALDDLAGFQKEAVERNRKLIEPIIELGDAILDHKTRRKAISALIGAGKGSRYLITRLVRLYLQAGYSEMGLAPRRMLRPGFFGRSRRILTKSEVDRRLPRVQAGAPRRDGRPRFFIDEYSREKIIRGASSHYHVKDGGNWRLAWLLTLADSFIPHDPESKVPLSEQVKGIQPGTYPSLFQFKYWAKTDEKIVARIKERYGLRKFNLEIRPLRGRTEDGATGPGSVYQIDSTRGDIIVVHQITRRPIGRCTIYLVVDAFSHLIAGWYIGLKNSGYDAAVLALLCAASDKRPLFEEYGLLFDQSLIPAACLPEILVGDSELDSTMFQDLAKNRVLGIRIAPAYRADLKGLVEAMLGSLTRTTLAPLAGHSNGIRNRGEENPDNTAAVDLHQLTKIVMLWVLQTNGRLMSDYPLTEAMIKDGVVPTPANIWAWGVANMTGARRIPNLEQLQRVCLPRTKVMMTRRGIQCNGLVYEPAQPTIPEFATWQIQAGVSGGWAMEATYHPENVGWLWLHHGGDLVRMRLTAESSGRGTWTLADLQVFAAEQAIANGSASADGQAFDAVLEAQKARIAREGEALTEAQRGTVAKRKREKVDKANERQKQQDIITGRPVAQPLAEPVDAPRTLAEQDEAEAAARLKAARERAA